MVLRARRSTPRHAGEEEGLGITLLLRTGAREGEEELRKGWRVKSWDEEEEEEEAKEEGVLVEREGMLSLGLTRVGLVWVWRER